ncbi:hypothetical protein M0R72_10795 [Candidatus Pacearchaeota archaeon]|nr:hypothetical protein [Candidatus Pacearchaeota archaeon]
MPDKAFEITTCPLGYRQMTSVVTVTFDRVYSQEELDRMAQIMDRRLHEITVGYDCDEEESSNAR